MYTSGTITFQGPQTCATSIVLEYTLSEEDEEDDRQLVSLYGTAVVNNTDIVVNITDGIAMGEAQDAYRASIGDPEASAAPGMNPYFDAFIYYNDSLIAELQAGENEYLLYFP